MSNSPGRSAALANKSHYSNGRAVEAYLDKRYHLLRQQLCCRLVADELDRSFHGISRGEIHVLELGSATGALSRALASRGVRAIASDIEVRPLTRSAGAATRSVCFDAAGPFPMTDGSLHGVVMGELIEHIFDTRTLLAETSRVLKQGGVVGVTTPNLATLQDRVQFLFGRSPRQVDPLHPYLYLHIRPFTYHSLKRALASVGFTGFRLRSNFVALRWRGKRIIQSRLMARIFPGLGGSLVVTARKAAIM